MNDPLAPKESQRPRWRLHPNVEQVILGLLAAASVLIGVLHALGLLESFGLGERIPAITLIAVGLIATYLVVERRTAIQRVTSGLKSTQVSLLHISEQLDDLAAPTSRITTFLDGLTVDRFAELRLVYGLRRHTTWFAQNEIRVSADEVFQLWADCLRDATTFYAFNSASPDEVWGTRGWALNVASALQRARLNLGCSIKRVFIIDSASEYDATRELMLQQADAGIEVRWILKSELLKHPVVTTYVADIGTWDYVVVDNDLLFRVYLDDKRRIQGCALLRDRELCRKALHAFNEALSAGYPASTAPGSHRPTGPGTGHRGTAQRLHGASPGAPPAHVPKADSRKSTENTE